MKLPSFNDFVKEYKRQVTEAVLKCLHIDEKSFSDHGVTITASKVKLEEYASPQLLFTVDTPSDKKFYGFSIQCLCNDEDGTLVDAPDMFVDLTDGKGGLQYATVYMPDELELIETIEVSLVKPIYENQVPPKGDK